MNKLPHVLTTSVVRASEKGESHGGMYLVDLETSKIESIIEWNKMDINWEGRGYDRGMRGIAFHNNYIYTAISDAILVFDQTFRQVNSITNAYLKHCHEISIYNDKIFITSTGFDSILVYDIKEKIFSCGYCLRFPLIKRYITKYSLKFKNETIRLLPFVRTFDPNKNGGPIPGDTLHINNVFVSDNKNIFVSGRRIGILLKINNRKVYSFSAIPYFTHNAMPYSDGVLLNSTKFDKIMYLNNKSKNKEIYNIPYYNKGNITNSDLPDYIARQGFGRGLCFYNDLIIGGSSPATISVYSRGNPDPIKSVNISMDIRNAIHGLEVFKYDRNFIMTKN